MELALFQSLLYHNTFVDCLLTTDSFRKKSGDNNKEIISKDSTPSNTLELWKNGEMYWKEGKLEESYLRNNPDRFTLLFNFFNYLYLPLIFVELQDYFVVT